LDVSAPAGDLVAAEELEEDDFGLLVPAGTDAGHDVGTLLFGEDVRHGLAAIFLAEFDLKCEQLIEKLGAN
jgi:hypothetical protein